MKKLFVVTVRNRVNSIQKVPFVVTNTNTFVLLMTKSQFKALGSLIEYKKPQKVIASELKTRIDLHDRRHGAGASDEQTSW